MSKEWIVFDTVVSIKILNLLYILTQILMKHIISTWMLSNLLFGNLRHRLQIRLARECQLPLTHSKTRHLWLLREAKRHCTDQIHYCRLDAIRHLLMTTNTFYSQETPDQHWMMVLRSLPAPPVVFISSCRCPLISVQLLSYALPCCWVSSLKRPIPRPPPPPAISNGTGDSAEFRNVKINVAPPPPPPVISLVKISFDCLFLAPVVRPLVRLFLKPQLSLGFIIDLMHAFSPCWPIKI